MRPTRCRPSARGVSRRAARPSAPWGAASARPPSSTSTAWSSVGCRRRARLPAVAAGPAARGEPGLHPARHRVRVVDEAGRKLAMGKPGELQFRGVRVLQHYRGNPGAGPDADGWFSTGDLGRTGPGGLLVFSGRRRDRLKVGGFSVFPAEVEAALAAHPDVAEVAVVGIPDERMGELPAALVVPRSAGFDVAAFRAFAEAEVAGYRRPREIRLVDALPRGGNGKLDRSAATQVMAALLAEAATPSGA
ncbi:MAG: fatty acid--CoA ligase family protein [Myxococcota bacterium]